MLGRYVLGIKEQRLIFQLFWFFHRTWFSCFDFSLKEGAVCLCNSIWIFHGGMIMKLFFFPQTIWFLITWGFLLKLVLAEQKKTPNLWCSHNGLPLNTWDRCLPTLSERLEKTSEMGIHTVPLPLLFFTSCYLLSSGSQSCFLQIIKSAGAAVYIFCLSFHDVGSNFQITFS